MITSVWRRVCSLPRTAARRRDCRVNHTNLCSRSCASDSRSVTNVTLQGVRNEVPGVSRTGGNAPDGVPPMRCIFQGRVYPSYGALLDSYVRDLRLRTAATTARMRASLSQFQPRSVMRGAASSREVKLSTLLWRIIPILFVLWVFVEDVCEMCCATKVHAVIKETTKKTSKVEWREL